MKKVLLFAIAVSAAFFLSCSADTATDYESGREAVWEAIGEQSPDKKAPALGGGITGACYSDEFDMCIDNVSEVDCEQNDGDWFENISCADLDL